MRVVYQRASRASVTVEEKIVGEIGRGALLLVGIAPGDSAATSLWMAEKIANLRVFEDEEGKMNRSLLDVGGEVLAISQFTLYGETSKGRRPSFSEAAPPDLAEPLYETFLAELKKSGLKVEKGIFGAHMEVFLVNDGPVTLLIEKK
ncbi:MAG TPA: D-aminoacyl-tRNA deacylase [Chroococcales cyanobacterium]|jgi:D-tyrosyl-tRNA(Tyr) deacylase